MFDFGPLLVSTSLDDVGSCPNSGLVIPIIPSPPRVTLDYGNLISLVRDQILNNTFCPIPSRVETVNNLKTEFESKAKLSDDSLLQLASYLTLYDFTLEAYSLQRMIFQMSIRLNYLNDQEKKYVVHFSLLSLLYDLRSGEMSEILLKRAAGAEKKLVNEVVDFLVDNFQCLEAEECRMV
jgi:hypothetical protein